MSIFKPIQILTLEAKDIFYQQLGDILEMSSRDKLVVMEVLNENRGEDYTEPTAIISTHGIGKMNADVTLLPTQFSITNMSFQLKDEYKTT